MKAKPVQYFISIIAVLLAILHTIRPDFTIDLITIALLVIAIIPWLGSLFKVVELPGGLKVEYHELEKVAASAKKAGLIKTKSTRNVSKNKKPAYQQIALEDPNLALAGLRIEMEKRLIEIAKSYEIKTYKSGVVSLSRILKDQKILTNEEFSVILDMIVLLNSAVHGAKVDDNAAKWALDTGNQILQALDEKIDQKGK